MESFSFQNLLNSQQSNTSYPFDVSPSHASVWPEAATEDEPIVTERKERRKWSPTEDKVLISAWLNTSKDPVVANEQRANAFWKRIASYFGSSPEVAGLQQRLPNCCKSRWGKINEGVCKFVGCYDAATKQKSSGQNEDDVMKMAHEIFFNDHKSKFTLEHAWLELRYDQKWLGGMASKDNVSSKRRKLDDQTAEPVTCSVGGDEAMARPPGVKAAKGRSNITRWVKKASSVSVTKDIAFAIYDTSLVLPNRFDNLTITIHLPQHSMKLPNAFPSSLPVIHSSATQPPTSLTAHSPLFLRYAHLPSL